MCLGVLGYLMLQRRFEKSEVTFVPSKFIQPLNRKARNNLIDYLIENDYISKFEPYEEDEGTMEAIERKLNFENYKRKPNLYLIHNKLRSLPERELSDVSMERTIITHLHHLDQQSFNHWAHNYRYIGIEVPSDDIWQEVIDSNYHRDRMSPQRSEAIYIENLKAQANLYGQPNYKSYDLSFFGEEDRRLAYRVSNIFTRSDPILRRYTTLLDAVEVGIKHSEGVIMADQLLKTIGDNDFSNCFIDNGSLNF